MTFDSKVSIIGCGNMGSALAEGMIKQQLLPASNLMISDIVPERLNELNQQYQIQATNNTHQAIQFADIIILAVKPQILNSLLTEISSFVDSSKLIISIAAGISLKSIESYLPQGSRVIRVMPNTPSLVGAGASAIAGGTNTNAEDIKQARHIFDAVGISVTASEEMLDAVTGLSGSGPAYAFIIIEALADAGVKMGLTRDIAVTLASQTLFGAAKLCLYGNKTPGQLKEMVTSPGGTTIYGIQALEDGKLRSTIMNAVEAATLRSRELGMKK